MDIVTLPIYAKFFGDAGEKNWKEFNTQVGDVEPAEVDFAVGGVEGRGVGMVALKILLLPWGLFEAGKLLLEKVVTICVLPAQLTSIKEVDRLRGEILEANRGEVVRHVKLQKDGVNYSGMVFGLRQNILNGKWALHATGNAVTVEESLPDCVVPHLLSGYNVLMVNLPNVGRSRGWPDVENMGRSQEAGIAFLETAIRAKEIVLSGFSLGGAAIGKAIMQHDFRRDVKYRVVRCMTFDRLSHLARVFMGSVGAAAIELLGYEMDNVASSRKLMELGIEEVVVQAGQDEVIREWSLMKGLQEMGMVDGKKFFMVYGAGHCDVPDDLLMEILKERRWTDCIPVIGALLRRLKY